MKKVIFLFFMCALLGQTQGQQHICIVSNTTSGWMSSTSQTGPFDQPVYDVGLCSNDCVIDCICGDDYGSPNVSDHFQHCCGTVVPIWGEPAPHNCYFNPNTYWFRQTFDLTLSPCIQLDSAVAHIQGDQRFRLFINGTFIGGSTVIDSNWNKDSTYYLTAGNLVNGENEILIEVANINGGSCFNYAFLAFCMEIATSAAGPDASFSTSTTSLPNGNHSFTCTATTTGPEYHHDWQVVELVGTSAVILTPPTCTDCASSITFNGTGLGNGQCRNFIVFHRIYVIDTTANPDTILCEAAWRNTIQICNGKPSVIGPGGGTTWGGGRDGEGGGDKGRSGGDRSNSSTGAVKGGIQVSPNPTQDLLNVRWADFNASQLKVINSGGQIVLEKNLDSPDASIDLQVGNLPAGIYILEIRNQASGEKLTQLFSVKK